MTWGRICSDHFIEQDINKSGNLIKLSDYAVPTRFKVTPVKDVKSGIEVALDKGKEKLVKIRKKLEAAQLKNRRLETKVKSLKSVIDELRSRSFISENCEQLLKQHFSGTLLELLMRTKNTSQKGSAYPPELKSFALTLQFYSTKAYNFVRDTFNKALPHRETIRMWYSSVSADVGFTESSFRAINHKVRSTNDKPVIVALMFDEMSIKKHVFWDGNRFVGYVDIGNGIEDDT
eukprot:TCONS_00028644-protein